MKLFKRSLLLLTAFLVLPTLVVACGDDDDDADENVVIQMDVPINAQTAELIVGIPFEFSDGGFFADEFAGVPMTLTQTSATTFTATGGGTTLTGTVTYGSCTYIEGGVVSDTYTICEMSITRHPDGRFIGILKLEANPSEPVSIGSNFGHTITVNSNGTCTLTTGIGTFTGPCTVTGPTGSSGGSRGLVVP